MKILLTFKISFLFTTFLFFFSACNVENSEVAEGGIGGSGVILAEGGIGGSGVVMGSITGFGSIYVNGVEYDTSKAQFYRDGKRAKQDDFSLGENIEITGTVDALTGTGVADKISYDSDIKGIVTVASSDNHSLRIMGQDVETIPLTVLNGFDQLQDLTIENYVEVSGSRNSEGVLVASSIKLIAPFFINNNSSSIAIEGEITRINEDLKLILVQDTIVDYSAVTGLNSVENEPKVGQYVEVESALNYIQDKILIASSVHSKTPYQHFETGTLLAVKGLVTDFDLSSPSHFRVAGQPIVITDKTKLVTGKLDDIFPDTILSVEGLVNENGELVASTVIVSPLVQEKESGIIESINNNKIRLEGKDIIINASTLLIDQSSQKRKDIKLKDLSVGTHIEVIWEKKEEIGVFINGQDAIYTAIRVNILD